MYMGELGILWRHRKNNKHDDMMALPIRFQTVPPWKSSDEICITRDLLTTYILTLVQASEEAGAGSALACETKSHGEAALEGLELALRGQAASTPSSTDYVGTYLVGVNMAREREPVWLAPAAFLPYPVLSPTLYPSSSWPL